jgi:SAM-dependent methyltransferase
MPAMPMGSVRGRIRAFLERHADQLGDDVLEVGSGIGYPEAWFRVNRDLARGAWLGIDLAPGPGVDLALSVYDLPVVWSGRFSGVVCSEVLEHLEDPAGALERVRSVMRPGAVILVTTLFAFPVHGFPCDYFRYTTDGLRVVLERAGFTRVAAEYSGSFVVGLNDHGEDGTTTVEVPIHTFATAIA